MASPLDPELPFAKPFDKGGSTARMMLLFMFISVVNVVLAIAGRWLFGNWMMTIGLATGVIIISVIVELLTKSRIEEQARKLEFVG